MGEVNYYLKKPEPSGKSLIYLQFRYNGRKLVFGFGQTINPRDWNGKRQRVKNNNITTDDGKHSLNDLLSNLERICKKAYNDELKNGIPTTALLRKYLIDWIEQNKEEPDTNKPTLFKLFDRFISGEIKHKGKKKSQGSLENYDAVKKHLLKFQEAKKYRVDYDTINLDFFYKYTSFLEDDLKLSPNTIAKDIRLLKVVLAEAIDLEETDNLIFKHKKFSYSEVETDAVYLDEKEIIDFYRFDLSNDKRLEQVRDLFVFGCFVGLRFSDYTNVKPENIIEKDGDLYVRMITQKTNELVVIPCNPIVLQIFEKYDNMPNKLPRAISNQKFNDYVKEAGKMFGEKQSEAAKKPVGFLQTGRLLNDPELPLYKAISSHTARRSFATNLYLDGFPVLEIMKITGHRSEKAFMKYIRVSKLDSAKRLNQHIKKNWSEKMLRIAT